MLEGGGNRALLETVERLWT
ncbi:hypothetical protein, partial [Streptomyces sp. WAC02707]